MRLSGGEIIARSLKEYGVTHVAGIPGHGNWALADAFNQKGSDQTDDQRFNTEKHHKQQHKF